MIILREVEFIFDLNNELDLKLLDHITTDPILDKREKRIIRFYLTKIDHRLGQQQIINKITMYFGYKRKTVLNALITLQEHYEDITERTIGSYGEECERIEKELPPA